MSQLPHVSVGDDPVDLTDGLTAGCYLAQVRRFGEVGVLIAQAATAPDDSDDWFQVRGEGWFEFVAGRGPVWAKAQREGSGTWPIAIART